MVTNAIESCIDKNIVLAENVITCDDEVDDYFDKIVEELVELMIISPNKARVYKDYLFIVKYLERMGDHATNIAEWIIYTVTGSHIDDSELT